MQYLRALAASMVLVGHVLAEAEHYFGFDIPLRGLPWTRGVDIFFVISGFIIVLVSRDLHGTPGGVRTFLRRRFRRVVPLYWLFTTLMLCILLVVPGAAKDIWSQQNRRPAFQYDQIGAGQQRCQTGLPVPLVQVMNRFQ